MGPWTPDRCQYIPFDYMGLGGVAYFGPRDSVLGLHHSMVQPKVFSDSYIGGPTGPAGRSAPGPARSRGRVCPPAAARQREGICPQGSDN